MSTIDISPNDIHQENGEMVAVWSVVVVSRSLRDYGEETEQHDKAIIPAQFAAVVAKAKAQNRWLRLTYLPILGNQTASDVQII